jgi:hypothetical protein
MLSRFYMIICNYLDDTKGQVVSNELYKQKLPNLRKRIYRPEYCKRKSGLLHSKMPFRFSG